MEIQYNSDDNISASVLVVHEITKAAVRSKNKALDDTLSRAVSDVSCIFKRQAKKSGSFSASAGIHQEYVSAIQYT